MKVQLKAFANVTKNYSTTTPSREELNRFEHEDFRKKKFIYDMTASNFEQLDDSPDMSKLIFDPEDPLDWFLLAATIVPGGGALKAANMAKKARLLQAARQAAATPAKLNPLTLKEAVQISTKSGTFWKTAFRAMKDTLKSLSNAEKEQLLSDLVRVTGSAAITVTTAIAADDLITKTVQEHSDEENNAAFCAISMMHPSEEQLEKVLENDDSKSDVIDLSSGTYVRMQNFSTDSSSDKHPQYNVPEDASSTSIGPTMIKRIWQTFHTGDYQPFHVGYFPGNSLDICLFNFYGNLLGAIKQTCVGYNDDWADCVDIVLKPLNSIMKEVQKRQGTRDSILTIKESNALYSAMNEALGLGLHADVIRVARKMVNLLSVQDGYQDVSNLKKLATDEEKAAYIRTRYSYENLDAELNRLFAGKHSKVELFNLKHECPLNPLSASLLNDYFQTAEGKSNSASDLGVKYQVSGLSIGEEWKNGTVFFDIFSTKGVPEDIRPRIAAAFLVAALDRDSLVQVPKSAGRGITGIAESGQVEFTVETPQNTLDFYHIEFSDVNNSYVRIGESASETHVTDKISSYQQIMDRLRRLLFRDAGNNLENLTLADLQQHSEQIASRAKYLSDFMHNFDCPNNFGENYYPNLDQKVPELLAILEEQEYKNNRDSNRAKKLAAEEEDWKAMADAAGNPDAISWDRGTKARYLLEHAEDIKTRAQLEFYCFVPGVRIGMKQSVLGSVYLAHPRKTLMTNVAKKFPGFNAELYKKNPAKWWDNIHNCHAELSDWKKVFPNYGQASLHNFARIVVEFLKFSR